MLAETAAAEIDVVQIPGAEKRPRGPRFGSLVHAVLATVPLDASDDIIERTAETHGRICRRDVTTEEVRAAALVVSAVLRHGLMARARASASVKRETPVSWVQKDGTLIEGVLDLAFDEGPATIVVDFKTDHELAAGEARYRAQLLQYVTPSSRATGRPAVRRSLPRVSPRVTLSVDSSERMMIGQQFGHYEVESRLGSGGVGEVFLARDLRLDRRVAIKVLSERRVADERSRARFRLEAHALSRLNHPNIATIFDFDQQDGRDFLVMEYIEGRSLRDMTAGALPPDEVLRLGMQLAEALVAAHGAGVVHLDLKPGNLMLREDGRLKVLDFGIARLQLPDDASTDTPAEETGTAANAAGTPPYMAPEQVAAGPVDPRTDIYAAGATLYELATGRRALRQAPRDRLVRIDPARQAGSAEPPQHGHLRAARRHPDEGAREEARGSPPDGAGAAGRSAHAVKARGSRRGGYAAAAAGPGASSC